MKKRLICILTTAVLLLALAAPVLAAQPLPPLEDVIVNACVYGQEADISEYKISAKALADLYAELFSRGVLPWYADTQYQYTFNEETGIVVLFQPETTTAEAVDMAAYEQKVAQILSEQIHEGMEDWQIALALHDYLIVNAKYDESLLKLSGYDLLVNGTAVCSGYTSAYQDLLQRAGIECRYVISEQMDHAWNIVKIGGQWYHVDLTWDDPTPNSEGFVDHKYFLVTDEEISASEKPHYGWDSDIKCTDTRFSQGFWRDVTSPILFESADFCYLVRFQDWISTLYRREIKSGEERLVYTVEASALDIGFGKYHYEHHGLSLRDGRLWFCSSDKVFSIRTDGGDLQTHYTNTGNTYIYSIHAGEEALNLTLMTHEGKSSSQQVKLEPTGAHVHIFVQAVIKPTCTVPGYTTSVCECGLKCTSTPTAVLAHNYKETGKTAPNLFRPGQISYICRDCDYAYTEEIPPLTIFEVLLKSAYIAVPIALVMLVVVPLLFLKKRR